jgi:hypothetical protein
MERNYIMATQTTAERMALIRAAAQKFQQSKTREARFVREEKVQETSDERYWTDAPRYADQYYGEVYRETTRFDNDWD